MFLDRAGLLSLSAPEWVALTGGMRVLGCNHDGSDHGVFTDRVGVLSTDFFDNLTSTDYEWSKADEAGLSFTLDDRATGQPVFRATRNDLVFGSNSQLRALAEVYASADAGEKFVRDFVKAWVQVMENDRYDLPKARLRAEKLAS
jgi:catalase-peroxidase